MERERERELPQMCSTRVRRCAAHPAYVNHVDTFRRRTSTLYFLTNALLRDSRLPHLQTRESTYVLHCSRWGVSSSWGFIHCVIREEWRRQTRVPSASASKAHRTLVRPVLILSDTYSFTHPGLAAATRKSINRRRNNDISHQNVSFLTVRVYAAAFRSRGALAPRCMPLIINLRSTQQVE